LIASGSTQVPATSVCRYSRDNVTVASPCSAGNVKSGAASPISRCPARADIHRGLNGSIAIAIGGTCLITAPKVSGGRVIAA
jgi:hypothetical protein